MYKLKIQDDEGRSTRVPMLKDEVSIGRDEGNTIRLTDRNVSRSHARLVQRETALHLVDLSRYGTQVNGMRIDGEHALEPHDVIQIGDYELSLEREGDLGLRPVIDDTAATLEGAPPPEELALVDPPRERAQFGQAPTVQGDDGRPRFMILSGALAGTEINLESDIATVGRGGDADIHIEHRSISRIHAELRWDGQQCHLVDTGSSNGVKVNGESYTQSALRRGDVVELGHVRLRYLLPGEVFVFDPATMTHDIEARSRATFRIFMFFLAVAIVLGVAWVQIFSKPSETPRRNETDKQTATTETGADDRGQPVAASSGVVKDPELLVKTAMAHMKTERWSDAIALFTETLNQAPDDVSAKAGLLHANNELVAQKAYVAVSELFKRGDMDGARAEVSRLDAIEETSIYHARALELRKAIEAGLISHLIDRGEAALQSRQYEEAIDIANEVLALEPNNKGASSLRETAEKRLSDRRDRTDRKRTKDKGDKGQAKADAPDRGAEAPSKAEVEPSSTDTGNDTASMTAKDYYKAARKVHNTNSAQALSLYRMAATKGYARAWRQMGSIHMKNGNKSLALKNYKKYLNLSPGAADAEVIRATIIRLGGTP